MSIFLFMKILLKKLLQFKFLLNVKHFSTTLVLTIVLTNLQIPAWAADGDLDTSFGGGDGIQITNFSSSYEYASSLAVQSDGKILVAGEMEDGSNYNFAIARYNADGSPDDDFGLSGIITTNVARFDGIYSIALQSDGKIVAAGYSGNGSNNDFAIARYNADGSPDGDFGSSGITTTDIASNDGIKSIAIQSDGKIVAAGYSENGGDNDFAIARYNANGSLDNFFGTSGITTTHIASYDLINSIALQSDGKIVAAGSSDSNLVVARYNADGSPDGSFGSSGKVIPIHSSSAGASAIALQNDGKIVAAGFEEYGSSKYKFAILRFNANGSPDGDFGLSGKTTTAVGSSDDSIYDIEIQSDGKIVAAGFSYNGTNDDSAIVRYNTNGSLDDSFGSSGILTLGVGIGDDSIEDIEIQSDGKIVGAGPSNDDFAVVRFLGSSSGGGGSGGDNPVGLDFPWVGDQSISCPEANPWVNEKLDFAKNVKPVLVNAENSVGRTIAPDSFESLKSSGVLFDTDSKKVNTATETLPDFGCKDRLLSGKVNQPIQFIAGGYTLQSDAHGYINTADLIWHDLNEVTLTTNTAAFMHTIKFTKPGKYMVVLTEQPDTSAGISPTYGARSIRFVININ